MNPNPAGIWSGLVREKGAHRSVVKKLSSSGPDFLSCFFVFIRGSKPPADVSAVWILSMLIRG
jgi:hypothetical protein